MALPCVPMCWGPHCCCHLFAVVVAVLVGAAAKVCINYLYSICCFRLDYLHGRRDEYPIYMIESTSEWMHKWDSNNNSNNKNRACLSPGLNAAILWRVNNIDKGRFLSSLSKKKPNSQSIVEFYHFISLPLSLPFPVSFPSFVKVHWVSASWIFSSGFCTTK